MNLCCQQYEYQHKWKVNAESKAWIWKGPGQLRISQCTLYEELYLLCSNQEQERYKDLPNCVTAVRVALINYSPQ